MTVAATPFGDLVIEYGPRLLTPREWTTAQSTWAAELLPNLPEGDVLEICAGAGHIGLLAVRASGRRLVCVDVEPAAADFITRNAAQAGMADRVVARVGRSAEVLTADERFPLIIADPPWVPRDMTARFPEDPLHTIDGGPDGLDITRECVAAMADHLSPGGMGLLQLAPGDEQADAVALMLRGTPLRAGERRHFPRGTLLRIDRV